MNENCYQQILGDISVYSALDVGCGSGSFSRTLADMLGRVEEIVGVDPDKESLDEARLLTSDPRVTYRLFSGYSMPFAVGRFDLASISNALHHVPDPGRLLGLMIDAVAPGGWIVVQELVSDDLNRAEENGRDVHHFKSQIDRLCGRVHNPTMSRDALRSLVRAAGLTIDRECEIADEPDEGEQIERVRSAHLFLPEYLEHARETLAFDDLRREAARLTDRLSRYGIATPPRILLRARKDS